MSPSKLTPPLPLEPPLSSQTMEEWGNARANEYYESNLPPNFSKPKDGDPVRVIEKFIRDKVIRTLYCCILFAWYCMV